MDNIRFFMATLLILGLILFVAKDRLGVASPVRTEAGSTATSTNPAGATPAIPPAPSSQPQEVPQTAASPRITLEAKLIGTMVVEGGRSCAVFELKTGQKLVRTGEEIIRGIRLVRVMRNQIEIARGGTTQEIGLGLEGAIGLAPAKVFVDMNPYDEIRRKKVDSLNRFRERYVGRKRG